MLIIERLRLFHRFRKHEGFLSSLSQCCVRGVGMWILGVTLADLLGSERSRDCLTSVGFSFPSVFGTVTPLNCMNEGYTFIQLVYHGSAFCWQRHFSLGSYPGESKNFHVCPGCLVDQLELLGSVIWTGPGKCQAFLYCSCLWLQPAGFWFPFGGLGLGTLPSYTAKFIGLGPKLWSRGDACSKGLVGLDCAGESGKLNQTVKNHLWRVCSNTLCSTRM